MVYYMSCMSTENQVSTSEFFERRSVFSLAEATAALNPPGGRAGTVRRLKHHIERGRVKQIERGIYAVVPRHQSPERFLPDTFLVARAARPDAVFAYHSALELLGAGHSAWHKVTVFTARRRPSLKFGSAKISFFPHPGSMRSESDCHFATRRVEWRGRILRVTGPERTLAEGMRRTELVGGFAELVACAGAFSTLDIQLLRAVLERYSTRYLWGATGWFLEKHRDQFGITDDDLLYFKKNRPKSPQYLLRDRRGGKLATAWNVILPDEVQQLREPDAS